MTLPAKEDILALVPMKRPFRFIDSIESVDENGIEACYRWRALDADGHMGNIRFKAGYRLTPEDFASNPHFNKDKFFPGYDLNEEDAKDYFKHNELIIPGVKIMECANQTGLVAWGIYLFLLKGNPEEVFMRRILFTGTDKSRFRHPLFPGDEVKINASFGKKGSLHRDSLVVEVVISAISGDYEGEMVYKGIHRGAFPYKDEGEM